MSQQLRPASVRKTYEFIKSRQRQFPVGVLCRVLQVAPSGFYAWLKKPVSDQGLEDAPASVDPGLVHGQPRYLAVVLDLFSRKVVGWAVAPTIRRELVLDAVLKAVRARRPRGTLSDQGSQIGSDAWRRFCRTNRLEPSMSRKGNCWDNAVVEAFFASLKKERIKKLIYKNRDLATGDIAHYIAFDHGTRRHSHLGGLSPDQCEAVHVG